MIGTSPTDADSVSTSAPNAVSDAVSDASIVLVFALSLTAVFATAPPVFLAKNAIAAALAASTAAESGLLSCGSLVKSICVGSAPEVVFTSTIGSCGR